MAKQEFTNKAKNKWLFMIAGFIAIFLFIFAVYVFFADKNKNIVDFYASPVNHKKTEVIKCDNCVRRNLDGVYVKSGEENLSPVAVIIENLLEARPQYGLAQANLVYEAEAEGRITRFLAIFDLGNNLEKIGPIRSARPYFIDWAAEVSALFVHCGGSPQALAKIINESVFDLNEFYNGDYFWRDRKIDPPHNIFISNENIKKYLEKKEKKEILPIPWKYKDDLMAEKRPDAAEIKINFPFADYLVEWKYNRDKNKYTRFMGGAVHKDASGEEIEAKNVIIEFANAEEIDEKLRLRIDNIGQGKAIVCIDGKCEEGEWRKNTSAARTRFYKIDGEEFEFNAGTAWIEVVRPNYIVEIK